MKSLKEWGCPHSCSMPATNASKPWPATRWPPRHTHSRRGGRVLVVRQVSGDRRTEPGAGAADLADVHHTIVPWTGGRWYALVSGALDAVSATDLFRRIRRARGTPYPGTWPILPSHADREPPCCGTVHCPVGIHGAHDGHFTRPPPFRTPGLPWHRHHQRVVKILHVTFRRQQIRHHFL